ncbi:TonB-dependent receptor [Marinifilum breve]|uniref:TonB-dependent receptor n=1 Tax=Marinifilum breve TaxID=2184082 RepID=A0A2V3ZSI6_9BACT|nr:TonB-dependent receptor [Marinifilum breve]PXX96090.1 TonB-dependent receptor [Marinifilum breve]
MRKIACLALIMLLGWQVSWAQDVLVKGVVTGAEDGLTIPGVSVVEKGTTNGTTTDFDGKYELTVNNDAVLVFSYIGMKTFEITVGTQTEVNVALEADNVAMDEVVVVGYGVQKKSDVTGSVATVSYEDLEAMPVNSAVDGLKGRIAGVQVVSNSGAPGGSISIRVRGVGSVNGSDPLYVVDGVPTTDITFLNPNDIASFDILKDASASAIYGSRGAHGVVLVTTKSGKKNTPTKVSVDAYYGAKSVINNWETTNASEWLSVQDELNKTRTAPLNLDQVDKDVDTDWFDELTQTATVQDYNININGGTEKLTYSMSGGYYNEEGTVIGSEFERLTARIKSDYQVKDYLKIGTNVNIQSNEKKSVVEGSYHTGTINTAIKLEPVTPVWFNEEAGNYGYSYFTDYPNPVAQINYDNAKRESFRLFANVYAELEPIKDLKFKTSYGLNRTVTDTYDFDPVFTVNANQRNLINKVSRGYYKTVKQTWENTLTYHRSIDRHDFTVLAGFTKEKTRYEDLFGSATNIPNEDEAMRFVGSGADGYYTSGGASELTMMSYLGRINYAYDNKYLFTANFRADGSSRFADGNRWGYFPSVALGWKISEEEFLQDVDWLSILKLRGGWGQIGNENVGSYYLYQTTMSGNSQYRYIFGENEDVYQGYVVNAMKDKNIQWETVESINFGVDAALFDARMEVSFDWFDKNTKDMLLSIPIPYYYGYESGPVVNVGEANNKGVEFSLNWRDQIGSDFSYNLGFNISTYKNEMKSLGSGEPISGGSYYGGSATRTEVGESIGYFYGYKTDGVFQNQAEIDAHADQLGDNSDLQPGDMRFVDVNGDGVVNGDDRTKIGSPDPDYTYGFNIGAEYKNWEFSAFFQGSKGNEIFNAMKTHLYKFDETNKHKDMLNSWTPSNTNTNMPRLNGNDKNNTNRTSDRFVEDGSYMRLKNLMVAYNLPKRWLDKVKLTSAKLYFSGQNLWTVTDYSGADPEIGMVSSNNYLSRGVDIGTYPQARTYVIGVKLSF